MISVPWIPAMTFQKLSFDFCYFITDMSLIKSCRYWKIPNPEIKINNDE